MVTHPFRAANLSGASPAQFAALFAPFVTCCTSEFGCSRLFWSMPFSCGAS